MDCYRQLRLERDVEQVTEFVQNRFYFVTYKTRRTRYNTIQMHFFTTDDFLVYTGFYADFGPLNLAKLFRYFVLLLQKFNSETLKHKAIVHYTSSNPKKRANAAFLAASFAVVYLSMSPKEVWRLLNTSKVGGGFMPFRDASSGPTEVNAFTIRIVDCLNALNKACFYNLVNFEDFDLRHYESFDIENYSELTWIVPEKLLALCNPGTEKKSPANIQRIIQYFQGQGVGIILRLNKAEYNHRRFEEAGIEHMDLFFEDGTSPSTDILIKFFDIVENTQSAVAVHCKAGLGRTGCLIGAYLMKHYRMSSLEAIAWLRICRPGCVIGHQQQWLQSMENYLWKAGEYYRFSHYGSMTRIMHHPYGIYSIQLKQLKPSMDFPKKTMSLRKSSVEKESQSRNFKKGSYTQGDYLLAAKRAKRDLSLSGAVRYNVSSKSPIRWP